MPRTRAFTRQAVIGSATEVFWETGFGGTSISDVERRTGLNRSSLYHAFGSKNDLFVEALDRYTADVLDPLFSPLEADPGIAGIRAFLNGVRAILLEEMGGGRFGCLMFNTIAERSTADAVVRRSISFRDRLARAITLALERDLDDQDPAVVRQRAAMLVASVAGIWTWARMDLPDAAAMCTSVAEQVTGWLPPDLG